MIKSKLKIFILLPDGVSLRNFAYTSFYALGKQKGFDIIFWNMTPFDLDKLEVSNIEITRPKIHWFTNILKSACKRIELKKYASRENDSIYFEYNFPLKINSFKKLFKSFLIWLYSKMYASEIGILKIREKIINNERKTNYYKDCLNVLRNEKPDFVFCTSQRSGESIAPLSAAADLGILTASFIFSWDNIPKATTVVNTNFYFVWSDLMKTQLLHYQTYIKPEQIRVTGTPQFEHHFDKSNRQTREAFFEMYNLDLSKKYICFSGDDITTSPNDELYLRDLAKSIVELNNQGADLGIIFRRCPVDFSDRYDKIISDYQQIIIPIDPLWENVGGNWNKIMPTKDDLILQTNIIIHTEFVVNLGSSMVFDYACYNKPCAYIKYNYLNASKTAEEGVYVYDYVHFRSMPSKEAVVWLDNLEEFKDKIKLMLKGVPNTVDLAKIWYANINMEPSDLASQRILETIENSILNISVRKNNL